MQRSILVFLKKWRHDMQAQDKQSDQKAKRESRGSDLFKDVPQKVEFTLCSAMANELGEVAYVVHIADKANLKEPIAFEIIVYPDGKLKVTQWSEDPEDALEMLAEDPPIKAGKD